jgi:hypothetical protein
VKKVKVKVRKWERSLIKWNSETRKCGTIEVSKKKMENWKENVRKISGRV